MAKFRVLFFFTTLLVVGIVGTFVFYYARGYRLDFKTLKFQPNGILVVKSEPDGASILINGELKTASNTTLSLPPGVYDVALQKEGYFSWYKRLTIDKEIVTSVSVSLFKSAPSLSAITFQGVVNPVTSSDNSRISFTILPSKNISSGGLYIMDTFSLPLGFTKDPRRITDGDLTDASYIFSPDGRQILLTTPTGVFVLDTSSFTPQAQMINVSVRKDSILTEWKADKKIKNEALTRNLPPEVIDLLMRRSNDFVFSPDENMILYQASASARLDNNLIKGLPGSSTQKQERDIKVGSTYIYDIKEDRNFLITDKPVAFSDQPEDKITSFAALRWLPTSRHLILAEEGRVTVMDYDGTNQQIVYSGSYQFPHAYPYVNASKLLVLTNLGATDAVPNLYSLTIK